MDASDELVICTLGRPAEVQRCLDSVARQAHLPSRVQVVDASSDTRTADVVEAWAATVAIEVDYVHAQPGLTSQRNVALDRTKNAIVHFVDDDTVLEPRYLESVLAVFNIPDNRDVLGVGGLITNAHKVPPNLAKRFFLLDGSIPGRVLPSGRNPLAIDLVEVTEVDWLSGCSMSFRRGALGTLRFNEALTGYGLGEDAEFSYRLRQLGRLVVTPDARLEHLQSQVNRLNTADYTYDELVNRMQRVRGRTGRLRLRWFWWSVLGEFLALGVASLDPRASVQRRRLVAAIRALGQFLKVEIENN